MKNRFLQKFIETAHAHSIFLSCPPTLVVPIVSTSLLSHTLEMDEIVKNRNDSSSRWIKSAEMSEANDIGYYRHDDVKLDILVCIIIHN